jgi:sortase A
MSSVRYSKYLYVKASPPLPLTTAVSKNKTAIFSGSLMFLGIAIITSVAWPIISFQLLVAPKFAKILEPIPNSSVQYGINRAKTGLNNVASNTVQKVKAQVNDNTTVDYTKASNWFPQLKQENTGNNGNYYNINIPKLGIENSKAIVGGDDLSESLIHYGGTALPGEYGNSVIFGHSTLPFFYDPENYTTIFSTLPSLNKGDEIFAERDGIKYKYIVEEMIVVRPKDVQILEQRFDDSYLTLVTCVPPGTYRDRLVVRARLQKI